jgi:AcrR family transcriptional regulator
MDMKASSVVKAKKDSYHHGHLREALLESALVLLKEAGLESLTLREVARRAGVSPGAPYHHFKDKARLVQALAQRSLETLDKASLEATQDKTTPTEKLHALGLAYIHYAVHHPDEFRIMFRPEMSSPLEFPDPTTAPVFRVLLSVIASSSENEQQQLTTAIAAWSLVHGLAVLLIDGPLHSFTKSQVGLEGLVKGVTARIDLA